jgi:hypothetical protein
MKKTTVNIPTTYVIRNGKLLAQVQRIFGEHVITDAWIADFSNAAVRRVNELFEDNTTASLDFSNMEIILEFINGRRVSFSNSEWGHINLPEGVLMDVSEQTE